MTDLRCNTTPWAHQEAMARFALDRPATLFDCEMGTGKSLAAIAALATAGHRRILVLCPKAVAGVWRREVARHWPLTDDARVTVLGGTAAQKAAQLRDAAKHAPSIVVVNYEAAWRKPLSEALIAASFDVVVGDESHRIKSPTGKASKFAAKVGASADRRLALTGTVMPHSPLDVYAQFRFLDPSVFGTSYTRFRARYAVCDRMYPSKVIKWINQDELAAKMSPLTFSCRAADVLTLPEITHTTVPVELDGKARKAYRDLERDLVAEIDGEIVTATNALAKLLRLQQVTSGVVAGVRCSTAKQDALADLIADIPASEPVVVFARFVADLDAVAEIATKLGRRYGEVSGRRKDLTPHSTMPEGIDLMGVQIQSGGAGIDLTRACYAAYFSVGFSRGDYEQSVARLHRPGQDRPVRIYHLVAERTVDEAVYKALDNRRELIESVLKELTNGINRTCAA